MWKKYQNLPSNNNDAPPGNPPPLQTPGLARDGIPGGGEGGRSPSDGLLWEGGGGLQGYFKANCGTLH